MAMGAAVRRMHAAPAQTPSLTKLALHPPRSVMVEFADDSSFQMSAEFLRVHSPAADSKIRSVSGEKTLLSSVTNKMLQYIRFVTPELVIFGRRHVGMISAESVGNYGVRTGIFTWEYLHHLGSNKFSLMRTYIRTLRKHGLSRDPQRRK